MAFGKEIKRLRTKQKGVSAKLMAEAMGVDIYRYSSWEKGDFNPRSDDIKLIEKYFGMPISEVEKLDKLPKVPTKKDVDELQAAHEKKVAAEMGTSEPTTAVSDNYTSLLKEFLDREKLHNDRMAEAMRTVFTLSHDIAANLDVARSAQQTFGIMSLAHQEEQLRALGILTKKGDEHLNTARNNGYAELESEKQRGKIDTVDTISK